MQRIMLATDFSERSDRALRRAVLLARAHGAVLDLVHVVDDDRPRRIVDHEAVDARTLMRELTQSLRSADGISCEMEIVLADPFSGIVQAADNRRPDLLVIGPHRRHILKDAFLGTTAERVIRSVDCPVLMVNGPPVAPWRHILLTTDLSNDAKRALHRFAALALGQDARRSILHVFDAPALRLAMSGAMPKDDRDSHLADQQGAARRNLSRFMADLAFMQAEPVVRYGETTTVHEIHRAAEALNADLIVIANRGKSGLARMVLGSVTEKVLAASAVDVLALPPTAPKTDAPRNPQG
ncbi:universal stress protein [Pontitalea aquivivens]|uniref:universal stress protein n=1 Tax=Pontitalea aquivivens TaxID=3388663 RepID=UPI00397056A4